MWLVHHFEQDLLTRSKGFIQIQTQMFYFFARSLRRFNMHWCCYTWLKQTKLLSSLHHIDLCHDDITYLSLTVACYFKRANKETSKQISTPHFFLALFSFSSSTTKLIHFIKSKIASILTLPYFVSILRCLPCSVSL